ncbi:hypothetical protein [Microseira wollei]|uniref:NERD domain-containing protein n=1 Tax=Microseira wollei NIES-4236 TaxID=2530354 RepID=A0AAV3X958_9CYAN|nr:hypothetical protein [Microseira wollei]GET37881.1 hypothetical protein MiSe_26350 [Microseira wollei NIES-4236]
MSNQQWLIDGFLVSFSTLIVGGTTLVIAASDARVVLAGSIAGASTGVAILARREYQYREEQLELKQVVNYLAKLEQLMVSVKGQIDQLPSQSPSLVNQSPQAKQSPVSENGSLEADLTITPPLEIISEQNSDSVTEVIAWLNARHFHVESYRQSQEVDAIFNELAIFMGERYSSIKPFYKQIKYHLQFGTRVRLNLSEKSKEQINNCIHFGKLLKNSSFLSEYHYSSYQKVIFATPQRMGDMINFFNGGWFERFVYQQLCDLLSSHGLQYQCLINPRGVFANTDDFELDLLFLVKSQPLWIECKSGDEYNSYLPKYSSHRQKLGVPASLAFLVILDIPDSQAKNYGNIWNITVVNQNNLISAIAAALGLSESQETQQFNQPVVITPGSLLTFLNKKYLRPLPEYRQSVIRELIDLLIDPERPINLSQFEVILAEKLAEPLGISKSKLHDILNAVLRSDCLLNDSGEIVSSFAEPISTLVSSELLVLDKKCIESYAFAILAANPNHFENIDNVSEFEQTVGGDVPNLETIEQLKSKALNQS